MTRVQFCYVFLNDGGIFSVTHMQWVGCISLYENFVIVFNIFCKMKCIWLSPKNIFFRKFMFSLLSQSVTKIFILKKKMQKVFLNRKIM